ncbi:MAG: YheC/YheD family protein [Clostridiales bacterium]|nr:YheC/YheD family protein [Clostridiales bacterium]
MWVTINKVSSLNDVILLPEAAVEKIYKRMYICFGQRRVAANVNLSKEDGDKRGESIDNPLNIKISGDILARLMISSNLVYRLKISGNSIIIGPVIGFLIGNRNYAYSPYHMEKYSDRFGIYNECGGLIYAFSPRSIDWENKIIYGLYYDYKREEWLYGRFPFPSVIYRRDFHTNPETIKKLIQVTHGKLFNSWRFSKYYLYSYIKQDAKLVSSLPPTALIKDYDTIKKFIDKYGDVILKPVNLSRGRGICVIKREKDNYRFIDYRKSQASDEILSENEMEKLFKSDSFLPNRYIVQKLLPLAKINGSVFDIRIVMQKDRKMQWFESGIECRVAKSDSFLTNISRGGYALSLDEALDKAFNCSSDREDIKKKIHDLCIDTCVRLDKTGHHFAELGIDIAIDENKKLYIIEVNVFPSFKGFKMMNRDTYLSIRYTPILYASYLAGF